MAETAGQAILRQLALERRRAFADWRALILLRRATDQLALADRRWTRFPETTSELAPLLRQMTRNGEIRELKLTKHPKVYEVLVPYAQLLFMDEIEVLLEINPYAVISHMSALIFHGLSDDVPRWLTVATSREELGDLLPLGTRSEDWADLPRPPAPRVTEIMHAELHWTTVAPSRFFGFATYQPYGVPRRVTNRERTLLDCLQAPEMAGGVATVLTAWQRARDVLNVDRVVSYVDRLGIAVLRQRVGFILETLDLAHPALAEWRTRSMRGGSSRLIAAAPYAPEFSTDWNLSLNAPVHLLREVA